MATQGALWRGLVARLTYASLPAGAAGGCSPASLPAVSAGEAAPAPVPGVSTACRRHGTTTDPPATQPPSSSSLLKQFTDQIRMTGPLTIHQYMRAVLTHPSGGYYMHRDVFGEHGDYTTSPEISQMFGELLGVWVYNEWVKMGKEAPLQLLELGPGRGTLVKDVLRVLRQLGVSGEAVHVHLVEISPYMRDMQRRALCGDKSARSPSEGNTAAPLNDVTSTQSPVSWHDKLDTVPLGFSMILAHEFFDVLPVHRLVKVENQWKEVLIDINGDVGYGGYGDTEKVSKNDNYNTITASGADTETVQSASVNSSNQNCNSIKFDRNSDSKDSVSSNIANNPMFEECASNNLDLATSALRPSHKSDESDGKSDISELPLRFVLSRTQTPASLTYTKEIEGRDEVEVSPEATVLMGEVATRLEQAGGAMLIIDYGHNGTKGDTFRAFRKHQQQHPLAAPGSADLTADVDFSLLKQNLPDTVASYGPVTQRFFLKNMGIELRLMRLLQSCGTDSAKHKSLRTGYARLVEELGAAFKVMAVYPVVMKDLLQRFPPPGFYRQLDGGWQDEQDHGVKEKIMSVPKRGGSSKSNE